MLQEAPDDALDANVIGKPWNFRPQTAYAAHNQVDRHTGLACLIKRGDDLAVHKRVHLHPDSGGTAGLSMLNLLTDMSDYSIADAMWARRHQLQFGRLSVSGNEIHDTRDVTGDNRIGGEQ